MIEKNWIQIRNQHWKIYWKMVTNVFQNFFWVRKNGSLTFLRMLYYAIFNSKPISSSKHFSKMLLKATKGLWIDLAAILIHQIHSLFLCRHQVIFRPARPLKKVVLFWIFFLHSKFKWTIYIFCMIFRCNARPLNSGLEKIALHIWIQNDLSFPKLFEIWRLEYFWQDTLSKREH